MDSIQPSLKFSADTLNDTLTSGYEYHLFKIAHISRAEVADAILVARHAEAAIERARSRP